MQEGYANTVTEKKWVSDAAYSSASPQTGFEMTK